MISCSSDDSSNGSDYYNLDIGITITIKDNNNIDLLNPNNPNAYLSENIKIYYLKENGEVDEVYNSNYDFPRNFNIITPEDSQEDIYAMSLTPNTFLMDNAITYIEWNDTEIDTIKTSYRYGKNYTVCNKVWYNNVNVWTENPDVNSVRLLEIIKD